MCRRIFGTIFFLIVLAASGVYYLVNHSPAPHAKILTGKAQQAAAERRIEKALSNPVPAAPPSQSAAKTEAAAPHRELSVHFAEDDINTLLATSPGVVSRLHRAKVDYVVVGFAAPNKMILTAQLQTGGSEKVVSVAGTLAPTDTGDVAFHSDAAQIGLLPLPVTSNANIDDRAAQLLALAMPKLPISVHSLSIAGGTLTLTGPRKQ